MKINPEDVRFFSGRSNPQLARDIANHLNLPLEDTKFSRFSNDNLFVQLGSSVRGRKVFIVQSLTTPVSDHLLELLMMIDIAKSAAATEIHVIIPYFSYARSDKKDAPRISITARLVADLLQTAGATHIMTMTLHAPQVHGFFSVPADPLTSRMEFEKYLIANGLDARRDVVVAPDMGRAKPAARFAAALGLSIASADKERISDTEVKIGGMIGRQVRGFERAIVYDDEIATAGSVVELSHVLVENGIKQITLVCTHGLFLGPAIERIKSVPQITNIVTTDTVALSPEKILPSMTIIPVGKVFAEAILQNYNRRSIGELFEQYYGS